MVELFKEWKKFVSLLEQKSIAPSSLPIQSHSSTAKTERAIYQFEENRKLKTFIDPSKAKPFGFYTSSVKGSGEDLTSEWYSHYTDRHGLNNVFGMLSTVLLLKIKPEAIIFEITDESDIDNLGKTFGFVDEKKRRLNWDEIAKKCHGIHVDGNIVIKYGWDVEQTVWFDTSVLELIQINKEEEAIQQIKQNYLESSIRDFEYNLNLKASFFKRTEEFRRDYRSDPQWWNQKEEQKYLESKKELEELKYIEQVIKQNSDNVKGILEKINEIKIETKELEELKKELSYISDDTDIRYAYSEDYYDILYNAISKFR